MITADPEVTCHDVTEEDEFVVIACDGMASVKFSCSADLVRSGIWDCLTSQQVVDLVRYQISEGKELTEVGEMICDHCLAPDINAGAGIGCDNMTLVIIGLTHGRSKEEWYAWIKERVKSGDGYQTPDTPPALYSQSRLLSFRARKEAMEAREREREKLKEEKEKEKERLANSGSKESTANDYLRYHGLNITTFTLGGISHQPGGDIVSDSGTIMFGNDDTEEDDDDDDETAGSTLFGFPDTSRLAKNLREQLAEFEKEEGELDAADGDANSHDVEEKASGMLSSNLPPFLN